MARELTCLLVLAVTACTGASRAPVSTTPVSPTPPTQQPPLGPGELARGEASRVELAPLAPCAAAASCEARLVIRALGEFKVNAEYPTKFVAAPDSTALDGPGEFAPDGATGVMTLRFRGGAEPARIRGTFKFSVCTEDVCKIEEPSIAFEVPAS